MKQFRAAVLCTLLVMPACKSTTETGKSNAPRDLKLAFVTNNSSDFWTIARRGVEKADNELTDVSAEFRITADGTAAEQKRIIDDLMTKGVDGIAISPVHPENQTALINDVSKKALVFTQDSDAPKATGPATLEQTTLRPGGRQAS
jgi:ribose transport system substrate-binding protein